MTKGMLPSHLRKEVIPADIVSSVREVPAEHWKLHPDICEDDNFIPLTLKASHNREGVRLGFEFDYQLSALTGNLALVYLSVERDGKFENYGAHDCNEPIVLTLFNEVRQKMIVALDEGHGALDLSETRLPSTDESMRDLLSRSVDTLNVPDKRWINSLHAAGIHTLGELFEKSAREVLDVPGIARKGFFAIRDAMSILTLEPPGWADYL